VSISSEGISSTAVEESVTRSTVEVDLSVARSVLHGSIGTVERSRLYINILEVRRSDIHIIRTCALHWIIVITSIPRVHVADEGLLSLLNSLDGLTSTSEDTQSVHELT